MENLNLEKFNPTVAQIQKVVDEAKGITISDFTNQMQLKTVKEHRIRLRDIRSAITKQGKEFRQEAVDFQKAVITKEKELIALVEPEEKRLKALEDQVELEKERAERIVLLPVRKDRLATIGDDVEVSDEDLIEMDGFSFESYFNGRMSVKLQEREQAIKAKEERVQREKDIQERENKIRQEERERISKEVKDEEERLAKDAKYQEFFKECGYSEDNKDSFYIKRSDSKVSVYKLVGELDL